MPLRTFSKNILLYKLKNWSFFYKKILYFKQLNRKITYFYLTRLISGRKTTTVKQYAYISSLNLSIFLSKTIKAESQ